MKCTSLIALVLALLLCCPLFLACASQQSVSPPPPDRTPSESQKEPSEQENPAQEPEQGDEPEEPGKLPEQGDEPEEPEKVPEQKDEEGGVFVPAEELLTLLGKTVADAETRFRQTGREVTENGFLGITFDGFYDDSTHLYLGMGLLPGAETANKDSKITCISLVTSPNSSETAPGEKLNLYQGIKIGMTNLEIEALLGAPLNIAWNDFETDSRAPYMAILSPRVPETEIECAVFLYFSSSAVDGTYTLEHLFFNSYL